MKRAANIIKGMVGKLPLQPQRRPFEAISYFNQKILKHQEDQHNKTAVLGGLVLHYQRPYELLHTYREIFERQIYRFQSISQTPLVIDCGSNIGLSVLYFKSLYPQARLLAFEPDETNFRLLQQNIRENGLQEVDAQQGAIWIENGSISFTASGSEASHIDKTTAAAGTTVKAVRLAEVLAQHEKVDFLKIDIEGAEYEVLLDCKSRLAGVDNMFFEYHGYSSETGKLSEILAILDAAGFNTYVENAANNLAQPFAQKTTGRWYDVQLNIYCYRNP